MTQEENELIAMKEMAEHRLRRLLTKEQTIYESEAYRRTSLGLRPAEFAELLAKLCGINFCTRTRNGPYGAYKLQFD